MGPTVIQYPLDPTGVNPNNLVTGEIQTMPPRNIRAVAPEYGAFFAKSLVITDMATNQPLAPNQFYAAEMYLQPTEEFGEEICSIIMITDPTVSSTISLQYQALGGEYSTSQTAIINQIYNLNLDDRPASWPAIVGKPNAFPPSAHLHDAGDLYGFEYVVNAIDRCTAAILMGDTASHDAIYQYIDTVVASLQNQTAGVQAALNAHIADHSNPHQTTAAQVGAYTTTQTDQAIAAAAAGLQSSINSVNAALTQHENDTSNPHRVTAAQVGAYTTAQTDQAIAASGAGLQTAINGVQSNLTTHIQDHTNPHAVTAAQVGAYSKAQSDANLSAAVTTLNNTITSNINNLQNQINGKASAYLPFALTGQNQTVSFWDIYANGTMFSAHDIWAFYSDERLKENIEPIKNALAKVKQISGVLYNHNDLAGFLAGADTEKRFMGLLAGEVQKHAPEVVGPAPFDLDPVTGKSKSGKDYLTIQYEKLTALIIEAVKDLDRKVDMLARKVVVRAGANIDDVIYFEQPVLEA